MQILKNGNIYTERQVSSLEALHTHTHTHTHAHTTHVMTNAHSPVEHLRGCIHARTRTHTHANTHAHTPTHWTNV